MSVDVTDKKFVTVFRGKHEVGSCYRRYATFVARCCVQ